VQYFVHMCHLSILPKCVSIMLLFITVLHYIQSMKIVVFHNSMTQYGCTIIRHAIVTECIFLHEIVKLNWFKINVK